MFSSSWKLTITLTIQTALTWWFTVEDILVSSVCIACHVNMTRTSRYHLWLKCYYSSHYDGNFSGIHLLMWACKLTICKLTMYTEQTCIKWHHIQAILMTIIQTSSMVHIRPPSCPNHYHLPIIFWVNYANSLRYEK